MMESEDERNGVRQDSRQPMTPKVRKFGTDLRTSARANRSAKKLVKVRKSATKKRSNKARTNGSSTVQQPLFVEENTSSNDASDLAYSVRFAPGSVGLKLEPVVESNGREVGCRVLRFADGGEEDPGQARRSGRIQPGDLLVAIDDRDVISWDYPDIIALLRRTGNAKGRKLSFRSVWRPTEGEKHTTQSSLPFRTNKKLLEVSEPESPVREGELSYDASTEDFVALTQSPAESVLHSHFLSGFQPAEERPLESLNVIKPDLVTELVPTISPDTEESGDSQSIASKSVEPDIDDDDSCFSPSRVKELSNGRVSPPPSKPISNVVRTVYRSVAPAAGVVASSSYSLTSTLTSAMSTKLGEALVGHKAKDFDSAVQLKMQLLSELSQAKVTLDRNLEEQKRLEELGQQLAEERDVERRVREEVESDLEAVKKEKASLELRLQQSMNKASELSEQLQVEQQKLRNTLKDGDVKVRDLESQLALVSSQAAQDRDRIGSESSQREEELRKQISEANSAIDSLNNTVQSLRDDVKDKDARLVAAENVVDTVRADAKAVEANLSRSLESAIETKEATENRLRDLEKRIAVKDETLRNTEKQLQQVAKECLKEKEERTKAQEELKLLRKSDEASSDIQSRLESQLASIRSQSTMEIESLKSTIDSLQTQLNAKNMAMKTVVKTTNALQAQYNARTKELVALKATRDEDKSQRLRIEEELERSQRHTFELEQLRRMISEKDTKLESLDRQFREARTCLEAMNQKLHEKIDALSTASEREQKLKDENESMLDRIASLENEKQRTVSEAASVLKQVELLQMKLDECEDSRATASREAETLREIARLLTERNENLQVDLNLTETKLAAAGISFLSKTATIDELRSVLATNDVESSHNIAEYESLQSKYDDSLAELAELDTCVAELEEENDMLASDLAKMKSSSCATETARAELEEKAKYFEQQLLQTRQELKSSQAQVLRQDEEIVNLKTELRCQQDDLTEQSSRADEQAQSSRHKSLNDEIAKSQSQGSQATRELTYLKDLHANEMEGIKRQFDAERLALEQAHELVVDRFNREVEEANRRSEDLQNECAVIKNQLSEALETVQLQEQRLQDEMGRFTKEKHGLASQIQGLEREKSALDSSLRHSTQQVSLLSEQLSREKESVSTLQRSHDAALEETRKLRNEMQQLQKVHLEDVEQMLSELDARARDEATVVLAKKRSEEQDARVRELERSLSRYEEGTRDLQRALESSRNEHENLTERFRIQQAELQREMSDRLQEKDEEIVSVEIRLDSTEDLLAESQVARRALEAKIVQAENRTANATCEAERLSKRIVGMENDLCAMANEIELLVQTNEQLERRFIEAKAARVSAEANAQNLIEQASRHEEIVSELNTRLDETKNEIVRLQKTVENLKSDLYDSLVEKEKVEAEKDQLAQSVNDVKAALEVSKVAIQASNTERELLQGQLSEVSEKLVVSNRLFGEQKEAVFELTSSLEELEADSTAYEQQIATLEQDCNEKESTLSSQREQLALLQDEIDRLNLSLSAAVSEKKELVSKATELKKRLESTQSLLEEAKLSQDIAAKMEVSNRTLLNRVDELEAAHDETLHDLNEAESSLASSLDLSKELKQQVDASQAEVERLKAQVQILESTVTRMKSERLFHEESSQKLREELSRAAEVKVDRAVSSLKNDSDSKARNLVELAAKLTTRSRLIAQSKLFERTLINFIDNLMERIDILLNTVASHSVMLKSVSNEKMGTSVEALDLALPHTSRPRSSSSCDSLVDTVSTAKKDFEEFKQELRVLKRGSDSEEANGNSRLLTPLPTPKHTALTSNLSKIKAILQVDEKNGPDSFRRVQSLREVVDYMELQIDGLIADLFASRRALESKEEALAELEDLVSMQESEKETLDKGTKSMQLYIKELEGKLEEASSRLTSSEDETECALVSTKKAAMKTAAAQALVNMLQRDSNALAGQALRKWSNNACAMKAVDQQKFVAEALARQLEITREKVAILKAHVKQSSTTHRREGKASSHLELQK